MPSVFWNLTPPFETVIGEVCAGQVDRGGVCVHSSRAWRERRGEESLTLPTERVEWSHV